MAKRRLSVRVSPRVHETLMAAANRNVSASAIVEAALAAQQGRLKSILDRLDGLDATQGRLEKEVALAVEMTAQFALYWMIATEPIPEKEKAAAQARGQRRYQGFEELVARKLVSKARLSKRIFGDAGLPIPQGG
jgi:hypothetical protein